MGRAGERCVAGVRHGVILRTDSYGWAYDLVRMPIQIEIIVIVTHHHHISSEKKSNNNKKEEQKKHTHRESIANRRAECG